MKFVLTIEFGPDGNDAMQDSVDVANALRRTAAKVVQHSELEVGDKGRIQDANGNSIGQWEIEE
jgi:hypothetical protein